MLGKLICLFTALSSYSYAANTKNLPTLKIREIVLDIAIQFPADYSFYINKNVRREYNEQLIRPFFSDGYITINRRYSSDRWFDVNIIMISYYDPYTKEMFDLSPEKLSKIDIELITETPKIFGATGTLYKLREYTRSAKKDFMRWVAVFGSHVQTVVIAAIYPSVLDAELSDLMRRIVEHTDYIPITEEQFEAQKKAKKKKQGGAEGGPPQTPDVPPGQNNKVTASSSASEANSK